LDSDFTALGHTALGAFCIALLAPWVEELLFRGAILPRLRAYSGSRSRGIVLSALFFGLIHINPAQVPFAFLVGLAFGWVTVCTRSLLPALIGHALNNSLGVVEILVYGHSNASTAMQDEPIGSLLIIVIAGTAVAIISGSKLTHHILLEREKSRTK
jgi:membrane protease YdiL (CAAX protease family)